MGSVLLLGMVTKSPFRSQVVLSEKAKLIGPEPS
jgi:hypothetical protein